jgi:hypothetical protein
MPQFSGSCSISGVFNGFAATFPATHGAVAGGSFFVKAVKGYRYLCRRGDQLYFRRRVPLSALGAFGGREEVQKSLGTGNIAEARHLLAIEVAIFDKITADAAGSPVADAVRQIVPCNSPNSTEMEEAVRRWFSGLPAPTIVRVWYQKHVADAKCGHYFERNCVEPHDHDLAILSQVCLLVGRRQNLFDLLE